MKNYSLSTKVTIFFALCVFLLLIFILTFVKLEDEKELENFKTRHFQAINYLIVLYQNNAPPDDIEIYFKNFGLKVVENIDLKDCVLANADIVFQRQTSLGEVTIYQFNKKFYLYIENDVNVRVLLESMSEIPSNKNMIWIFVVVFALLTWIYITTLLSIVPLKKLTQSVRKFASGDLYVEHISNRRDEIGELSNDFNRAVHTIRDLVTSRQLFLRTIMHELKTPIGKGRILTEMVKDETQQERFRGIFERLEILMGGFSKMEQVLSKNYHLDRQECTITKIFEDVYKILMLEPEQIGKRVVVDFDKKRLRVNVDIEAMTLAFKNLIDNALKYSSDRRVKIVLKDNIIYFINKGEPLEYSIKELFQPFVTTAKKESKQTGLGLGLYIVESILQNHQLELEYRYKNETHELYIDLSNVLVNKRVKDEDR